MRPVLTGIVLALLSTARAVAAPATAYTIAMPEPSSHFFHVTARFEQVRGAFRITFPAWTPGGYVFDEVAGDVVELTATDGAGKALAARKIDIRTWETAPPPDRTAIVRYRVWADERGTPYDARLNGTMGHANLVRLLGYAPDRLAAPARVTFEPYGAWKIATSLDPVAGDARTFTAPDYDALADAIVLLGDWSETRFAEGGATYRYVFSKPVDFKKNEVVKDVKGIIRESAAIFGVVPFDTYLFLLILEAEAGRGGIEHSMGTSMCLASDVFDDREKYLRFLGLTAHEFVHAWNVKRMRPEGIGPYAYDRATPTHNLYVAEGFTTYYGGLASARGGAVTREELFKELGDRIVADRANPGVRVKSLEDHSWDWWLESKIPFLTFRANYSRGGLVGFVLDQEIREKTNEVRSLDDVMKGLYAETASRATGYTDAELRKALVRWGAPGMDRHLDALVKKPGAIDLAPALSRLGLEIVPDPAAPLAAYVGWRTSGAGAEFPSIDWVEPGSPAAAAGLEDKDLVVALDGKRVSVDRLDKELAALKPGAAVQVSYFRDRVLKTVAVLPEAPRPAKVLLRPKADATADQKKSLDAWLAPRGRP